MGEALRAGRRAARRAEPRRRPLLGAGAGHPPARRLASASCGDDGRCHNTSVLIGPDGADLAATERSTCSTSRSAASPTASRRSRRPGRDRHAADPLGPTGLTRSAFRVCYDLRFPELYRILAVRGARLVTVPSAFTMATGRDHWQVLLRARAIENQLFVLAPNQFGEAPPVPLLRALGDRRSLGRGARHRAGRGVLHRRRPRPRGAGAGPRVAALARQPQARGLPLAAARRGAAPDEPRRRRSRSAARSSTPRSASSPARASTRPGSPTSPTRPASPTGSSTTTSTPRTRC